MAQFRAPNTDEDGKVALPTSKSIQAFQARLPAEKLIPLDEEDDAAKDRILSLTLFGEGRIAFQQERYNEALAAYQRAWFWNPDRKKILEDVPWMAFQLDRRESAFRYAIIAGEIDPERPANTCDLSGMAKPIEMLADLSMMLAAEGEIERGRNLLKSAFAKHFKSVADGQREERDEVLAILHMNNARLAMLDEDYAEAAQSFDFLARAINKPALYGMDEESLAELIDPERSFYGMMAESYLRSEQFSKARRTYATLSRLNESEPLDQYHRAVLAFHEDKLTDCKDWLTKYFKSKSFAAGAAPYELLRQVFEDQNPVPEDSDALPEGFAEALRKLTNADPANQVLAEYAGDLFAKHDDCAFAQELLAPLLSGEPTIQTSSALLRVYTNLDLPGKTVALLGAAVDRTGDLLLVENVLDELTSDEAAMKSLVKEANRRRDDKLRPMSGSEAFAMSLVLLQATDVPDHFSQAERFYATSVERTRDEELLASQELTWAEELFFADHLTAAKKSFTKVLEEPAEGINVPGVTELLVMAQALDDETEEAIETIDRALAEYPDAAGLRTRRGWVLYQAKRYDEAEKDYTAVIDTFAEDFSSSSVRRAVKDARSIYSNILLEKGDLDGAAEQLLLILDEDPEDIGGKNDLSYLWSDAGIHLQRALELAKEAVAEAPDSAAYLDTLAWAHYRSGNFEPARKYLERATGELEADDSVIVDHLGDVYEALGQVENAVTAWRKAIESLEKVAADGERKMTEKEKADRAAIQKKIDKR